MFTILRVHMQLLIPISHMRKLMITNVVLISTLTCAIAQDIGTAFSILIPGKFQDEDLDKFTFPAYGWLALVAEVQSRPQRLERHAKARERLLAVTAADLTAVARRYLTPERLLEVQVLPQAARPAPPEPAKPAPTGG